VLLGEGHDLVTALDRVGGAGDHVRLCLDRDMARFDLVAQGVDRLGGWPDPDQPGVEDCLGERGVLGQEAVAGVYRVSPGLGGDLKQLLLHKIRISSSRSAEGVRLVRDLDMQGVTVRIGIDSNRTNPAVLACPSDSDRDLAAVCNQNFADGRHVCGA